jgi:branched-chain amino acid transport system ATP-binding protein
VLTEVVAEANDTRAVSAGPGTTPGEPGESVLEVRGLETGYGRIKALNAIDLDIRRGELVALVGANGAGKTTLLRTISGVQPATQGRLAFLGEDITHMRAHVRVRRGICQVPEGRQVFGPLSVEDNLRLGAYTQPKGQANDDLERVYIMFPVLKEKRELPAGTLSGGQQQMLAVGRALMGRPKLLLLDEPSMGLAPLLVADVFKAVRSLKTQGMTIFLVEQNAFAALAVADRGYVIETGSITMTGTGKELLQNEEVKKAYLGI